MKWGGGLGNVGTFQSVGSTEDGTNPHTPLLLGVWSALRATVQGRFGGGESGSPVSQLAAGGTLGMELVRRNAMLVWLRTAREPARRSGTPRGVGAGVGAWSASSRGTASQCGQLSSICACALHTTFLQQCVSFDWFRPGLA
eukprot:Hpha_TRINITY_DN15876_c0_g2::TRINITY_DN15876_c0_g2_i1::g.190914::m.190914